MEKSRWQIIEKIFFDALELTFEERHEFVRHKCGADKELCREILLLIENDHRESSFLDKPVFGLGARLLNFRTLRLYSRKGEIAGYKPQRLIGEAENASG